MSHPGFQGIGKAETMKREIGIVEHPKINTQMGQLFKLIQELYTYKDTRKPFVYAR